MLCCSVLQCVAVCCSVLQCVAVCWHTMCIRERHVTHVFCCSVLQCVAVRVCIGCRSMRGMSWSVAVCCGVLRCVAVCCSARYADDVYPCERRHRVLQSVAVCCSVLQCVAVCSAVLQGVAGYAYDV